MFLILFFLLLNYFCFSLSVPGGVWARADISSDWPQCWVGYLTLVRYMRVARVATRDARDVKYLM